MRVVKEGNQSSLRIIRGDYKKNHINVFNINSSFNLKARLKDNEGIFFTYDGRCDGEKHDVIKPKNIIRALNKNDIGKETLEYLVSKNLPVIL